MRRKEMAKDVDMSQFFVHARANSIASEDFHPNAALIELAKFDDESSAASIETQEKTSPISQKPSPASEKSDDLPEFPNSVEPLPAEKI